MSEKSVPQFIVIDDDAINNMICRRVINTTVPGAEVQTFQDAEKGLSHILSTYSKAYAGRAILFLDINMPSLSGWDVLERFKNFNDEVRGRVTIYMLSSSVNSVHKTRARNNTLVSGYITKPLSEHNMLSSVLPGSMKLVMA